jgi:hypothetical protein|tara:strand:+ start:6005 stop:6640 length:636 start_codon:yes stop_codon:yes gene_type:complete
MTTQIITHKCGHESEKEIVGAYGQELKRESAIAKRVNFHANRDCFDCFKANSSKNDLQIIAEYPILLADLEGSEKQVNWANSIRVRKMAKIIAYQKELPTLNGELILSEYVFSLADLTSAKFWIDTRDSHESFFFGLNEDNMVHQIDIWSAKDRDVITVDARLRMDGSRLLLGLRGFTRNVGFEVTYNSNHRGDWWNKSVGGTKWHEREVI